MNKNEIRPPRLHRRPAPSGLGWLIVVIVIVVGASALVHTLARNKTHSIGRQQAAMEREIAGLEEEMRALDIKIEEALSRKNLTDRLAARRTQLRDITPETMIRISVTEPTSPPAAR